MSQAFEFEIDPKDAASAVYMGRNHRALLAAAIRAKKKYGITQQQIAEKIGVHKSVISRALSGRNNLTERTFAEICWAIGVEPRTILTEISEASDNEADARVGTIVNQWSDFGKINRKNDASSSGKTGYVVVSKRVAADA